MNNKILIVLLLAVGASKGLQTEVKVKEEKKEPLKIIVIEGKKVISDTLEGKEIEAKLNVVRNKYDSEIKALDQKIEKEITELRGRARTVDPETLEKDQARIMREKKERDVKAESAQEEFGRTVNRELGKFNGKIQETIIEEAVKNNWDIVSVKESGEIVYVSPRASGTEEIIKAHNKKFSDKSAKDKKAVPAT